jgi:hypothetical protein
MMACILDQSERPVSLDDPLTVFGHHGGAVSLVC